MESFLNRYRSITVLLLVIFAQLILLAVQVKNDQDVRIIRLWTVSAVTPVARVVEWVRGSSIGFIRNYFYLKDTTEENRRMREELGRLRIENNYLKNELATADRAKALQVFQAHTPSRMLAANVIGIGAGANSKVVFVNRGSSEGVMRGMAVVTPDGIVGKIISAYPTASEVLLITAPEFAAGVVSPKHARGTVKGQGSPLVKVDYVAYEDKVEPGEWFYTSGDDRIFPRGFQVGVVKSSLPGQPFKEILLEPSGLRHGLEDVLIVISNVHQDIPQERPTNQPVYIAPAPPADATTQDSTAPKPSTQGTEADRLRGLYKAAGEAQGHNFGEGAPGSRPPDFTKVGVTGQGQGTGAQGAGNGAGGAALGPSGTGGRGETSAPAKQAPSISPAPRQPLPGGRGSETPAKQTAPPSPTTRQPDTPAKQPSAAPPAPGPRSLTPNQPPGARPPASEPAPGRGNPR